MSLQLHFPLRKHLWNRVHNHILIYSNIEKKSSFLWYIRAIGGHCTNSMKSLLIYANLPAKLWYIKVHYFWHMIEHLNLFNFFIRCYYIFFHFFFLFSEEQLHEWNKTGCYHIRCRQYRYVTLEFEFLFSLDLKWFLSHWKRSFSY